MRISSIADIESLGPVSESVKKQLIQALKSAPKAKSREKSASGLYPSMNAAAEVERQKRLARSEYVLLPEYDEDPDPESVLLRECIKRWGHAYFGGHVIPQLIIPPRKFRMDVAIVTHRICIEFDGWSHHSRREATKKDHEKMEYLAQSGWVLLRIGKARLKHDLNSFLDSVENVMQTRPAGSWSAKYNKSAKRIMSFYSTLFEWCKLPDGNEEKTEFIHKLSKNSYPQTFG